MDTLSKIELDRIWKSLEGHAPEGRAELLDTLRGMVATSAASVKVTRNRVEVKMPLVQIAFDRR